MSIIQDSRAKTALEYINKDIVRVEREIAERTTYLEDLVAAKAVMSKTLLRSMIGTPKQSGGLAEVPRVKAVQMVLDGATQPLTAAEIAETLAKKGRNEERKSVAAAIGYLKQHGKVQSTERGKWIGQQQIAA